MPLVAFALAIGAAPTERRALCENLAVVFIVAARTIMARFAARMFLPGVALATTLARTVEFRAIFARARKARTLLATAVVARLVEARLVEIPRAIARRARVASGVIGRARIAFHPRLCIAAISRLALAIPRIAIAIPGPIGAAAKILARTTVWRAT